MSCDFAQNSHFYNRSKVAAADPTTTDGAFRRARQHHIKTKTITRRPPPPPPSAAKMRIMCSPRAAGSASAAVGGDGGGSACPTADGDGAGRTIASIVGCETLCTVMPRNVEATAAPWVATVVSDPATAAAVAPGGVVISTMMRTLAETTRIEIASAATLRRWRAVRRGGRRHCPHSQHRRRQGR